MRRAYLLVFLPAVAVGIAYALIFRSMGMEIQWAPFAGALGLFMAAILLVRRHQRRRPKRQR